MYWSAYKQTPGLGEGGGTRDTEQGGHTKTHTHTESHTTHTRARRALAEPRAQGPTQISIFTYITYVRIS